MYSVYLSGRLQFVDMRLFACVINSMVLG